MLNLILTCGAVMGAAASSTNDFSLSLVDGTRCLDGSPAGHYYDVSNNDSTDDTLVIFLEGGGACSTQEDCLKRAEGFKGSSDNWPSLRAVDQTYLSTDPILNPDFHNAHHVYVPYCSGDTHRGTRTVANDDTFGLWFSGHLNVIQIVNELQTRSWFSGINRVMLIGSSAGGAGTIFNADRLSAELPAVTVKAVPLAGWFFPGYFENNPNGHLAPPSLYPDWLAGQPTNWTANEVREAMQQIAPTECVVALEALQQPTELCGSATAAYPFITTPMFIVQPQFDTNQLTTQLLVPGLMHGLTHDPQIQEFARLFGEAQRTSVISQLKGGDGYFLHSCACHCARVSVEIEGINYLQAVGDWFYDRNSLPHTLVDLPSSTGLPFNPTCPGSTTPPTPPTPPAPTPPVCRDDPSGALQRIGRSCAQLIKRLGCDFDLSNRKPSLPTGTFVKDVCPVSCDACPEDASTSRRRLLTSAAHFSTPTAVLSLVFMGLFLY